MELQRSGLIVAVFLTTAYAVGMDDLFTMVSSNDQEMCQKVTVCKWFKEENICKCIPVKRSITKRTWCTTDDEEKCVNIMSNNFLFHGKCEWLQDTKCCSCPSIFIGK